VLASIVDIAGNVGLPVLGLLVSAESMGIPLPGETALITMALVASQGRLSIVAVIVVAAAGAIVGDNIGFFFIGRKGGRRLLERPGRFQRERRRALELGDPFFERHGGKAVFFGRWITGLRTWASWLAGASEMKWHTFVIWNAAGGILWATTVGLAVFYAGAGAKGVITQIGLYALITAAVLVISGVTAFLIVRRRRRRRADRAADADAGDSAGHAAGRGDQDAS
jgi:membrane protein DedA with SNARE-associated domain